MSHPFYILISGKRYSGKSTFAYKLSNYLYDNNVNVRVMAFANEVKKLYSRQNGIDFNELLSNREEKELHRSKIILLAEEMKKQNGQSFWANVLVRNLKGKGNQPDVVIIDDLRFQAEVDYFNNTIPDNFTCIRLDISEQERFNRGFVYNTDIDLHSSETDLDFHEFDYIFNNSDNDCIHEFVINNKTLKCLLKK